MREKIIEILEKYQMYEVEMPISSERINEISFIADEIDLLLTNPELKSAEEIMLDYTGSSEFCQIKDMNWTTAEVLAVFDKYSSQQSDEEFSPVKQRRLMFDKFYEWMDTMDEHEFDQYSTTALCETFFFDLQQPPK